jgi:molecular chaperone DnaK
MSKKVIGIDLGTSTSCVSVFENGEPTVIVNSEGKRTTPSVIGFDKDGTRVVGDAAERQAVVNPKKTIYEIKRFMGNTYDESKAEAKRVTYEVINDGGYPKINVNDRKYTPQELSAAILQKMKKTAEDYVGEEIKDAVITVPAYFSDTQRQATKEAGEIAGLNVMRIINEPTAAALAYGLDKGDKDLNIAVFDAGGGTFDVTIMNYGAGVFEVLSTNGDTHLGGSDFTEKISNWIAAEFKKDTDIDILGDAMAMQRVREAAEKAKIELSTASSTDINLPYLSAANGTPQHFMKSLSRAKFEQMVNELVERHATPCKKALGAAKLTAKDIDEVILVGGTTRIPAIQKKVKEIFGKEPSKSINPDEAVSLGASIQGAVLAGDDKVGNVVLLDVNSVPLGIQTMNDVFAKIIDENVTIPTSQSQTFTTAQDNQTEVQVAVYQGTRQFCKDNKLIGNFNLTGILPARRGIPQIEVTLDIDANGILKVSAKDKGTGKEQSIRIEGSSNLSKAEIERMKADAKANEEADKKKKKEIDEINNAEAFAYTTENLLKDNADKMTDDDKKTINDKLAALREALGKKDIEMIKQCRIELENAWETVSKKVYGTQSTNENSNEKKDGTEEVKVEEV